MIDSLPNWLDPTPWIEQSKSTHLQAIENAIYSDHPRERELALMLSPAARPLLETMAQRAQAITRRHFGRTISLYTPLYLSNYCNGGCLYCGIAADRRAFRAVLNVDQLDRELDAITQAGLDEIVLLTGERMPEADTRYIREAIERASRRLNNINIEVFPMQQSEYRSLAEAGCTGVTLYQETYDPIVYEQMHRWGDKRNFESRLDAPHRALEGGLRTVGLGVLLGLADPASDLIALYRHATHLLKSYWQAGVTLSSRVSNPKWVVSKLFILLMRPCSHKQFLPCESVCQLFHLLLSTREAEAVRNGLAGIGISKMSVASKTTVGGYSDTAEKSTEQFSISDERSVDDFCQMLREKGLEPVFKNYDAIYREPTVYASRS